MKKVDIIDRCWSCSFFDEYNDPQQCGKLEKEIKDNDLYNNTNPFPSWCPLPSAEPDPIELIAWYFECWSLVNYLQTREEFNEDGFGECWDSEQQAREDLFNFLPGGNDEKNQRTVEIIGRNY